VLFIYKEASIWNIQMKTTSSPYLLSLTTLIGLTAAILLSTPANGSNSDPNGSAGAVYTASNSSAGNDVLHFKRSPDGTLTFSQQFATGGAGNDLPLGNQGGVTFSQDGRWLLVINAGSNNFSAFEVQPDGGLVLTDTEPSNGLLPLSVTISGNLVYVVNGGDGEGDTGNIAGFTIDDGGGLTPILGSIRALSGTTDPQPAQIQFNPLGNVLVVTEKATNFIDTYAVDGNGVASEPVLNLSHGVTPFGFSFSKQGFLIVSEAFAGLPDISAVSSYAITADNELRVITPSAPTEETAACWIVITESGKFAYATNTGSGTVSGFRIGAVHAGQLTALDHDGITAKTGFDSGPIDAALSEGSEFLYVLNSLTFEIVGFRVDNFNGSLHRLSRVGGLPTFAFGLVAR
jgi:6-phosphogluconolactonase